MKLKVLVIVGPTASGKSALAVRLAKKFGGEIISADSRQVYKGLDIGTGKITEKEMKGVRHHLFDVASPKKQFSAGDFVRSAQKAYSRLLQKTAIAIVVGGTGYYVDAFVGRIGLPEVEPNIKLRRRLEKKPVAQLFAMLKSKDPRRGKAMASASERNNKVRLIRALEITAALGKVPVMKIRSPSFDCLWIGIRPVDMTLRRKIHERLSHRLRKGMVAEALRLHRAGLSYKRMTELGLEYRSLARYLQKRISRSQMQKELESDIWRYARKQIGYWKRNKDIRWFEPKQTAKIERAVRAWLKK